MNSAQNTPHYTSLDNEKLADEISCLAAHIHAATYRFLVLIREFDEREAWLEMGAHSCVQWLNWRCGISPHTAREKLRVAHALADLDKISASFGRGELSYSKVRAVTRVANEDNESLLLNIALSGTASQLERVVQCDIRCERENEIRERTEAGFEHRSFTWNKRNDGTVEFFGRLPAELAEHVINAIEANLPEVDTPSEIAVPDQASTIAECELINDLSETTDGVNESTNGISESLTKNVPAGTPAYTTSTDTTHRKPTIAMRRADALVALCSKQCTGYEVTLHVPAGKSPHANTLKECGTIPIDAARRLCCDASIVPITEDNDGTALDIGRKTRIVPPPMRRALEVRDKGGCRFPGCTHKHFLHAHHIKHWAFGGKTCLDNLVLLCSHHHHLVHEGGFSCLAIARRNIKGVSIVFKTPGGVIIADAFRLRSVTEKLEDVDVHEHIGANTAAAGDFGTRLDMGVVIDGMRFIKRKQNKRLE